MMTKYLLILIIFLITSCKIKKDNPNTCYYLGMKGLRVVKTLYQPNCDGVGLYNIGELVYVTEHGEIVAKSKGKERYKIISYEKKRH